MTLDMLDRKDIIKILDVLKGYIETESAARRKAEEVKQVFINGENDLKKNKKYRRIGLAIVFILTQGPLGFAVMFMATALFSLLGIEIERDPVYIILGVLGAVVFVAVLFVYIFLIKRYKRKNKEERIKVEEHCSGIYAYLPYYESICSEYQQKIYDLQCKYNIHNNMCAVGVIDYVKSVLISTSTVSLNSAINDYYQMQHNEMMRDEARRQTNKLEDIRKENQEHHIENLKKLEDIRRIESQQLESLNEIRYR